MDSNHRTWFYKIKPSYDISDINKAILDEEDLDASNINLGQAVCK